MHSESPSMKMSKVSVHVYSGHMCTVDTCVQCTHVRIHCTHYQKTEPVLDDPKIDSLLILVYIFKAYLCKRRRWKNAYKFDNFLMHRF